MSTASWTPFSPISRRRGFSIPGGELLDRGKGTQLVTLGEAMIRLSVRAGDRLEDAPAFDVHVAGSEANVAFAAARVGLKSAWISALPANPLGRRVVATLAAGGVDTSLVRWVEGGRLGLYFVEMGAAPRPISVVYDRAASTMALATEDAFDWNAAANTRFLHVSGITLGLSSTSREIAERAMEVAKRGGGAVSLDVNYRQRLWAAEEAAAAVRAVAPLIDVLVCTAEDARDLFGATGTPQAALANLQARLGVETVVLTLAADGAIASRNGVTVRRGGFVVEAVDRVGAGDAFVAGLIWGLLDGSLEIGLERGLAMSALKMTLRGDLFWFDASDVAALLARHRREVGR
jgi:2-dehydro-3-deoxygluconokinase